MELSPVPPSKVQRRALRHSAVALDQLLQACRQRMTIPGDEAEPVEDAKKCLSRSHELHRSRAGGVGERQTQQWRRHRAPRHGVLRCTGAKSGKTRDIPLLCNTIRWE